jgi:hypothetical protein
LPLAGRFKYASALAATGKLRWDCDHEYVENFEAKNAMLGDTFLVNLREPPFGQNMSRARWLSEYLTNRPCFFAMSDNGLMDLSWLWACGTKHLNKKS